MSVYHCRLIAVLFLVSSRYLLLYKQGTYLLTYGLSRIGHSREKEVKMKDSR